MAPTTVAFYLALPLILVLGSASATGQASPSATRTFDASGHGKSHGARLTVAYPAGLTARESARQRVVQSFIGNSDGVDLALSLSIEAGDEDVEAYCAPDTVDHWRKVFQPLNLDGLEVRIVRWKNRHAVLLTGAQVMKLDDLQIHSRLRLLSVCHKRYRVSLSCSASGISAAKAKFAMQRATPVCERFYDSLSFKA